MVGGNKYNGFFIDIWATGIILFAMLCGYLPFEDDNNDVLFKQILGGKIEYPNHLSEVSKDLLKKIIETDPEKRIKIEEIKEHPFYLMGKKCYEKKFKKMKIHSLREFNYDLLFNKINYEKEKEIANKGYMQTEINDRNELSVNVRHVNVLMHEQFQLVQIKIRAIPVKSRNKCLA